MVTKKQEQQIIDALNDQMDVQDVYFHKGVLYACNAYDIPAIEEWLDETSWAADVAVKYVEEEPYNY